MTKIEPVAAFLTARLDEDEAAAKAAAGPGWFLDSAEDYDKRSIRYTGPSTLSPGRLADYPIAGDVDEDDAAHIARYDPARMLREVAAKRAILAEHRPTDWSAYGDLMCFRCRLDDDEPIPDGHHWVPWPCPTVRALAAVWSDHPDYRGAVLPHGA